MRSRFCLVKQSLKPKRKEKFSEDLKTIISHDLFSMSPIFEVKLTAHAEKSKLVSEIKPSLDLSTWNQDTDLPTHVVGDFMSKTRQVPMKEYASMG